MIDTRNTLRAMSLRRILGELCRGVSSEIGRAEILIIAGLGLITVGLWPHVGRSALIAPGVIILVLALAPFRVTPKKG